MTNHNVAPGDAFVGVLAFEKSPYVLEGVLLKVMEVDGDHLTLNTIPVTEGGELFPQTVEGTLQGNGTLKIGTQTGEHELLGAIHLGKPVQEATLTDVWSDDTGIVNIHYTAGSPVATLAPSPTGGYHLKMSPIEALYDGAFTVEGDADIYLSNDLADTFATEANISRWNIYNVNCFKQASQATPVTTEDAQSYETINSDPYAADAALKAVGTAQRHMYRILTTGLASTLSLYSSTSSTGEWEAEDSTPIIRQKMQEAVEALDEAIQHMETLKARINTTYNPNEGA